MSKSDRSVKDLFDDGVVQEFAKDEVIVNAFDDPEGMYLIEKGYVKSYSISESGDINIQLIRTSGDIFPLLWAIGKIKRDVYFAAMDDVVVRKLPASDFLEKINSNKELAVDMNQRLSEIYLLLAERVRNLEQRRANERLIYCLRSLGERFGKKLDEGTVIDVPLNHHDIADMINTSRETTSRDFVLLEKRRLVGYKEKQIILYPKFDTVQ